MCEVGEAVRALVLMTAKEIIVEVVDIVATVLSLRSDQLLQVPFEVNLELL